jgi:hypothetical protein
MFTRLVPVGKRRRIHRKRAENAKIQPIVLLCVVCDFAVNYFVCFTGPLGSNSESANPLL